MARTGTGSLEEILQAVVDRIIDQLPLANAGNCYLCIDLKAAAPSAGEFIFAVAPLAGTFDEGLYDGGGHEQTTVDGGITVKIFSPLQLDEARRDAILLTDASRSILKQWTAVVKALSDPEWSPVRGEDEILRDPLIPAGFGPTREDRSIAAWEQDFKLSFDLDLTGSPASEE